MPDNFWENPALNPTRTWEDSLDVRNELSFIVRGSTPADRLDFLRELLTAGELKLDDSRRRESSTFFNKIATAFGFVPLIDFDEDSCRVTFGAVAPLRKVFSSSYAPGD